MTDATYIPPKRGRAKIRIKVKRHQPPPDPGYRTSWAVDARRLLGLVWINLGFVSADGEAQAIERARTKWPNETHLQVRVADDD